VLHRRDIHLVAAALCALLAACKRGGGAEVSPLTYDGATSISRDVLAEAVPSFEAKAGVRFGRVDRSSEGEALERLFAGEVQIAGVARWLTAEELARQPYVQIIGYDAVGVFVNEGSPVKALTKAQLKAIFTGAIISWKDVGGPNLPIVACTEPLRSGRGVLAVFQAAALDEAPFGPVREEPDPAACLRFVAATPGAVSFAPIASATPGVRRVVLDGVEPDPARVLDSTYLLSRPLLLVARRRPGGEAAAFFDFMRSAEGQRIVGRNFIPVR
jgi:phosphate transport system substrate-binding protein